MPVTRRTPVPPAPAARPTARPPANQMAAPRPNGPRQGQDINYASLNPEDYTQGGLLDDVDVTFRESRFCEWDYNGAIDHPVLALLVVMDYVDLDGKPASADQYYSAGELSRFVPSEDGTHAISVAGAKGLAGGTNAAELLKSVIGQGFPVDRYGDGDVSAMDGLVCHINRIAQPKRGGQITGKTKSGYDATIAVVTKIHRMPWEAAATTGKAVAVGGVRGVARPSTTPPPSTRTTATAASPSDQSMDVSDEAAGILLAVLKAKGGTVKKMGIAPGSFKLLAGNGNRSAILNLLADDEFLGRGDEYGWSYDGQTVTVIPG